MSGSNGRLVKQVPGGWRFSYPNEAIELLVNRVVDDRRSLATSAEITIRSTLAESAGHLHQARVNLTSTRSKAELIRALLERDKVINWEDVVEAVCLKTLDLHRQGEPIESVGGRPLRGEPTYRLRPLLPEKQPAVIFAEGGSGKSYLAKLFGIAVQTGKTLLGLTPLKGNVLYLDWETSRDEVNDRVAALCKGLGLGIVEFKYRYCYQSLADDLPAIQDAVGQNDIQLIIVDSLGAACGGDPSAADVAIRMFAAIRSLRVTSLLLDHTSKNSENPTPFGSVYKINYGRSVWEARRIQRLQERTIRVALYHKKVNNGPLQKSVGFCFAFDNDEWGNPLEVNVEALDVTKDPELSKGDPLRERIYEFLKEAPATKDQMADGLGANWNTIKARIGEMRDKVEYQATSKTYRLKGWSYEDDHVPF